MDKFGEKYKGKEHDLQLKDVLEDGYKVTTYWYGNLGSSQAKPFDIFWECGESSLSNYWTKQHPTYHHGETISIALKTTIPNIVRARSHRLLHLRECVENITKLRF